MGEIDATHDYLEEAFELGFESPIEQRLFEAVEYIFGSGTVARQVQIGPYRADMVVRERFVIEADGRDYHDPFGIKDRTRDEYLLRRGLVTIRCSGSVIRFHHRAVAKRIKEIIGWYESTGFAANRLRVWRIYREEQLPGRNYA